jgi:hypothetical protein
VVSSLGRLDKGRYRFVVGSGTLTQGRSRRDGRCQGCWPADRPCACVTFAFDSCCSFQCVFADRILGVDVIETRELRCEWNAAIDNAALAKLRFRNGAHVRLIAGEHLGKSGTIRELGLRHLRPYLIDLSEGGAIWAADNEVELLTT